MAITSYKTRKGNRYRVQVFINGILAADKAGFATKQDAKNFEAEVRLGKAGRTKHADAKLSELIAYYKEHFLGIKKRSTQRKYVRYLKDIEKAFGNYPITSLASPHLERYRTEMRSRGNFPKTVNDHMSFFRGLLQKGIKWKFVLELPDFPEPLPEPKLSYQWWDDKAYIARFLSVARKHPLHYLVFRLALETGMREGEIFGLGTRHFDPRTGVIHIERQWSYEVRDYGPPKNNEIRFLKIDKNGEVYKLLVERLRTNQNPEILLHNKHGRMPKVQWICNDKMSDYCVKAGVPNIRFHDIRHTFASWFMIEVDDLWQLSGILGHSDIKMTQIYAHHSRRMRSLPNMGFEKNPHELHMKPDLKLVTN